MARCICYSNNKFDILLFSDLNRLTVWLNARSIEADYPKHVRTSNRYTNDDLVVAAAKIGLEYVQLWNDNNSAKEIMRNKLADIYHSHQDIYNNEMNEAAHISWTIYQAALSNRFAGYSSP